ncbi:MAG: glycosyltransferase [Pseudobacteriovorax sp.]|nr:glycosyltransferase [Pseudobacteriovorax sp.]
MNKMTPTISFVMPVKNGGPFLKDAIEALQKIDDVSWELAVVDDGSTDETWEYLTAVTKKDDRIQPSKNLSSGKVKALNQGYRRTKGQFIKCIDADDVLLPDFCSGFENFINCDSWVNNCQVTDQNLNSQQIYNINPRILESNFQTTAKYLISIPRHLWTFSREIGDKIFPMPETLPFEDVWFALMIKKYSRKIGFNERVCYLYRQHGNQTYGGILNYSKDIVHFRANRMLCLIDALQKAQKEGDDRVAELDLKLIRNFYQYIADRRVSLKSVNQKLRIRAFAFRYLRPMLPLATRVKWFFDANINRKNKRLHPL